MYHTSFTMSNHTKEKMKQQKKLTGILDERIEIHHKMTRRDCLFRVDKQGTVLSECISDQLKDLLGHQTYIGSNIENIDFLNKSLQNIKDCITKLTSEILHYSQLTNNTNRIIEVEINPVESNEALLVLRSITVNLRPDHLLSYKNESHVKTNGNHSRRKATPVKHVKNGSKRKTMDFNEELRASEKKFKDIFNSFIDIYYQTDKDGILTVVSPSITKLTGYTPEEVLGQHASSFYENKDEYHERLGRIKQNGEIKNEVAPLKIKDQSVRMFSHSTKAEYDDNGNFCGTSGTLRDVTEQVEIHDRIKQSATAFYTLQEKATDAIIIIDSTGNSILDVNKQALLMIGLSKKKLMDSRFSDIQPALQSADFVSEFIALQENEQIIKESKLIKGNKEVLDIELSVRKLKIGGQLIGQLFIRDITLKNIQKAIKAHESTILEKIALNYSVMGILNHSCTGLEKIFPDMTCSIMLFAEENQTLSLASGPKLSDQFKAALSKVPIGPKKGSCGSAAYYKKEVIISDIRRSSCFNSRAKELVEGEKFRSCWSIPLLSSKENLLGTFAIYYTDHKKPVVHESQIIKEFARLLSLALENFKIKNTIKSNKEKLQSLNDYLLKQNKQLEEYAHITSHNFRAPVTNILSLIELKEGNPDIDDDFIWKNIKKTTRNLEATINDLNEVLSTSWELDKKIESLKFSSIYRKIINSLKADIESNHVLLETDFLKFDKISYSKIYLESIMQNLITNAIKYAHPTRRPEIKIWTEISKDNGFLKISDNGLGMNMKEVGDKIFGLRKTFHNNKDSRGVGLFIIKAQIESMGGSISVESEVNQGTTFVVDFGKINQV